MGASSKVWRPFVFTVKRTASAAGDEAGPAVAHLAARRVELGERPGAPPGGRDAQQPAPASGAKTISSPSLQLPPRLSRAGARATGAPPSSEIFFSDAVGEEADPLPVGGEEGVRRSRRSGQRPRLERVHPPLVEPLDRPVGGDVGQALPVAGDGEPAELVPGGAQQGRPVSSAKRAAGCAWVGSRSVAPSGRRRSPRARPATHAERGDPRRDAAGLPGRGGRRLHGEARLEREARLADVAQAPLRVALEAAARAGAGGGGGVAAGRAAQSELALQDGREHVADRLALEEPAAGQHLEEHDAEGPDVGALVDRRAARLLGRHVGGGAEDEPGGGAACARAWGTARGRPRTSDPCRRRSTPSRGRSRAPSTLPSGVTLTLAGLRSRWTMPFSCASSSASAICLAIGERLVDRDRSALQPLGEVLALDELHGEEVGGRAVGERRALEAVDVGDVRGG